MKIIADLHLHSRFSRACSKALDLKNMEKWAKVKGTDILGTGDFQHPLWLKEIKSHFPKDNVQDGILNSKSGQKFLLTTEISLIYSQGGKGRRIHNVVWSPSLEVADQIVEYLSKKGRLDYDGRPIFKIPCPEFTEALKEIDNNIEIIPAHIWTPWFSLFGANSGFDSLKECFQDQAKNIFAIETGMSSDPPMNWRIEELKNKTIVSFSDSHSFWPWRLAREATIFDVKQLSYKSIIDSIRNNTIASTVEVDPSYGIYHFTGHRKCGIVMSPKDAEKIGNICPVCKRKLTVGVMERVEQLATHPEGYRHENSKPFYKLLPLSELIAGFYRTGMSTKKSWSTYNTLLAAFGSEFKVLLDAEKDEIAKCVNNEDFAEVVLKNRQGKIRVKPGFDGIYGVPLIHGDEDYKLNTIPEKEQETETKDKRQKTLGDF